MVNNIKQSIKTMIVIFLSIVFLVGCGEQRNTSSNGYRSVSATLPESQLLAENNKYELLWEKDAGSVLIKSTESKKIWSDILYELFLEGSTSSNANSPINITVVNTKTLKWDTLQSYAEISENGSVVCKKINGGIRVTYFFDKYKIAIPVEYVLTDSGILVSLDASNILEDGEDYKLVSVSLVPMLCSVKNDDENANLFIPTGNGALMNASLKSSGVRKYSAEVYGADDARQIVNDLNDEQDIKLPVFGAYSTNGGILGIITKGAAASTIDAQAGNERLGYSNVGVTFYVRGYDQIRKYLNGNAITQRINENLSRSRYEVKYYLFEGSVDYNDFASLYREYLLENKLLEKSNIDTSPYSVTFIGGTSVTDSILGIPKRCISAITTFEQAQEILEDLNDKIGIMPEVRMYGYADKALYNGEIIGGKTYPKEYGSKKDLQSLLEFCSKNDLKLYFDSDIVNFSKSGLGFSVNSDVLKTAIGYRAEFYPLSSIRVRNEGNVYCKLAGEKLEESAECAIEKAKKYGYNAIAFSSLGNTVFTDYTNEIYTADTEKYAIKAIEHVKNAKMSVAVADANDYVLCAADISFNTPNSNGNYDVFDETVPFYQMVFHSYKPMYSSGVNLFDSADECVAKAMAFGMGAGFTFTKDYEELSDDLDNYRLYAIVYEDNDELIKSKIIDNNFSKIFDCVKNSKFINYKILDNGISISEYDNGVKVYVNNTDKEIVSEIGVIKAYSFDVKKEG